MSRRRRERALPPRDAEVGLGEPGALLGEGDSPRTVGTEGVQAFRGRGRAGGARGQEGCGAPGGGRPTMGGAPETTIPSVQYVHDSIAESQRQQHPLIRG